MSPIKRSMSMTDQPYVIMSSCNHEAVFDRDADDMVIGGSGHVDVHTKTWIHRLPRCLVWNMWVLRADLSSQNRLEHFPSFMKYYFNRLYICSPLQFTGLSQSIRRDLWLLEHVYWP